MRRAPLRSFNSCFTLAPPHGDLGERLCLGAFSKPSLCGVGKHPSLPKNECLGLALFSRRCSRYTQVSPSLTAPLQVVRALTDGSLFPSIPTTLIRRWLIAIPAGRRFMHDGLRNPSSADLRPGPTPISLPEFRNHLTTHGDHHMMISVLVTRGDYPLALRAAGSSN